MVRRPVVSLALTVALVATSCSVGPVSLPFGGSPASRAGLPECTSGIPRVAGPPAPPAGTGQVAGHPRLWITVGDLPRLRSWATISNPVYSRGVAVLAGTIKDDIKAGKIPQRDSGSREYEEFPTEAFAAFFAFLSLISPDQTSRDYYARCGRALLMYVMDQAAKGPAQGQPFRGPTFAGSDSNRARWQGESYGLAVDWLYPVLTSKDKATIRKVFLRWCQEIVTTGYHAPKPVGVVNDPRLLSDRLGLRWAANNYVTALARNLGLMAMSMDPADDPGGLLAKYLGESTGAFLYQIDALYRGDARGGLGVEGFEYGPPAVGYWAELMLALHTAGQDDPSRWGPQTVLTNNPFWRDVVPAFLNELSAVTVPNPDDGTAVYQPAMFGDAQRFWMEDPIELFGALGLYDAATGNASQLGALRWIETNMAPGGKEGLLPRIAEANFPRNAMLYFLLLDPAGGDPPDPHQATPTSWFAPGLGRLDARTDWGRNATWFNWALGWNTIDHQHGDGNSFSLYRKGEWLTRPVSGYDLGTSDFKNTIAIHNGSAAPDHNDYRQNVAQRGSQWPYFPSGDGKVVAESLGSGYAYALGDATPLYNDLYENLANVSQASRSVLWLEPDVVVLYDRAATKSAGHFKRFWLSLPSRPSVNGRTATAATAKGQQVFVTSLLPTSATLSAVGIDPDPKQSEAVATGEPMRARLEVEAAGAPLDTRFLTVVEGADAGGSPSPVSVVNGTGGAAYVGVALPAQRAVVLFPTDLGSEVTTLTYAVPNQLAPVAGAARHFITGLQPNARYDVQISGGQLTVSRGSQVEADSGGVLVIGE